MSIDVKHIADLAMLSLEGQNIEKIEQQMQEIVEKISTLPDGIEVKEELNVEDKMVLREDVPAPSMSRDSLLENAPQKQAGCIVVPKIV